MNDHMLRTMIRQRHEQIAAEVRDARRRQPVRLPVTGWMKQKTRRVGAMFTLFKRPMFRSRSFSGESQSR